MPENHDCSQDLALEKIKDEVIKKVLDEEDFPELIKGVKLVEKTVSFQGTFSGETLMLKVIKGHSYEIHYHINRPYFQKFGILISDEKVSMQGTSPVSQDGKFLYSALSTGMIGVNTRYLASLNDFPQLFVDIIIYDLGSKTELTDRFKNIPIIPEEKQIIIELESYLNETIPVVEKLGENTFGIIIKNNHVKHIDLHSKGLEEIPSSIWELKQLKTLDLSSNRFKSLPEIPKWHDSLQELNLSHNLYLQELPKTIDSLKALKKLNLSHRKSLSRLPLKFKDIGKPFGLDSVDLSHCNISIIVDLENSTNIFTKSLDFRGNPISLKERKRIYQWDFPKLFIEPILFFIEKESKLIEDTPVATLRDIIKNDLEEDNRVVALYIIINNYFSEEIPLIRDIIIQDESTLVITTMFKLLKKINNKKSDVLIEEILMRYSRVYHISEDEVQFFIDLEAELVEEGDYEIIKIGHYTDYIYYGPLQPSIQDLGIEYDQIMEYFGNSDIFRNLFWVDDGNVKLLVVGGFLNKFLPDSIGHLKNLEFLDLRGSRVKFLPKSFKNLKKLRKFFVDCGFDFQNLDETVKKSILNNISHKFHQLGISDEETKALACFEIIYGQFLQVDQINEEYANEFVLNDHNQVIAISIFGDIEDPSLTIDRKIPDEIILFKNLEEFLVNYSIVEIPDSIGTLKNLKKLNLVGNKIKLLPYSLNSLKNLEELYLSSNKLKTVPNKFTNLQNLKRLEISYNKLKSVPDFILSLKKLEILDLSNNRIEEIPNEIIY
ncbi:MAG: leucine-rich repeat domain-containing protein [Candidatus Thorarchaeota archaeon]